jgi:hypothetical protein
MDLAEKHGLKAIYSIKDWYVGTGGCPGVIKTEADEEPQVRARVRQVRDQGAASLPFNVVGRIRWRS